MPLSRMSRRGFTLVELLIVVAIVSILMAMLLPILKSARDTARTVSCANNLKQLHLGHDMYASDFGGWTPVIRGPDGTAYTQQFWKHVIGVYVGLTPDLRWEALPGGWSNLPKCVASGMEFPNTDYARRINKNMGVYNCPAQDTYKRYGSSGDYQDDPTNEIQANGNLLGKKSVVLSPRQIFCADSNESYNGANLYSSSLVDLCHKNKAAANFVFVDGHLETTGMYRDIAINKAPWVAP